MKPIQITLFIFGFFILSCTSPKKEVKINQEPKKELHPFVKWEAKSIDIDSFMISPFNLQAFKAKKNGSNWSTVDFKKYHYQPSFKGQGFMFFMFEPKEVNYISDGRKMRDCKVGYTGKNKNYTSFLEDGLIIKTLRPSTKEYTFSDTNEILIELTAKYNDFDLPEMAYVGIDSMTIIKVFGKESFYKKECLVYDKDKTVFILHLKNGVVNWLKFVRLSNETKNTSEIGELFELN